MTQKVHYVEKMNLLRLRLYAIKEALFTYLLRRELILKVKGVD